MAQGLEWMPDFGGKRQLPPVKLTEYDTEIT